MNKLAYSELCLRTFIEICVIPSIIDLRRNDILTVNVSSEDCFN